MCVGHVRAAQHIHGVQLPVPRGPASRASHGVALWSTHSTHAGAACTTRLVLTRSDRLRHGGACVWAAPGRPLGHMGPWALHATHLEGLRSPQ